MGIQVQKEKIVKKIQLELFNRISRNSHKQLVQTFKFPINFKFYSEK